MSQCRFPHRYTLYDCRASGDGRIANRQLLSANDLPVLRYMMARLGMKGWLVRIWDKEKAEYLF